MVYLKKMGLSDSFVERIKDGYDIKFIKKSKAASIAKHLKKYFHVKESYKFVGEKKGKRLYRNYYSVK